MSPTTICAFPGLPGFEALDKRLTRDWDIAADEARAVETAGEVHDLLGLRAKTVDLAADLFPVWHAASVLWDLEHFNAASALVSRWRLTVQMIAKSSSVDTTEARIWASILSAELEHRLRNHGVALDYVQGALTEIRFLAGSDDELQKALKLGKVTPLTEMCCAALAIGIPAARVHLRRRSALRHQYLDRWMELSLLILERDLPPPFLRIHALVIQTFFAVAEEGRTKPREETLDRLERFDDLVRPRTTRGLATKRLREIARARFDGNSDIERSATRKATEDLKHLPRHRATLTANGWWSVGEERRRA